MQVGFFSGICLPCYELMTRILPQVGLNQNVWWNLNCWVRCLRCWRTVLTILPPGRDYLRKEKEMENKEYVYLKKFVCSRNNQLMHWKIKDISVNVSVIECLLMCAPCALSNNILITMTPHIALFIELCSQNALFLIFTTLTLGDIRRTISKLKR